MKVVDFTSHFGLIIVNCNDFFLPELLGHEKFPVLFRGYFHFLCELVVLRIWVRS